jgi:peptide/nickel transport system substrate-binding protein
MLSPQAVAAPAAASSKTTLRVGVLSALGTLDPREAGDTITGLVLGQIFEKPYAMNESGGLEPSLFADGLKLESAGPRPIYSAAVRSGIVFSDGTPLTAEIAAASLAKSFALRGRATVVAQGGRVVFTMSGPSPRFENVLSQWNTAIVLERRGTFVGTGPYKLAAGTTMQSIKNAGFVQLERNPSWRGAAIMENLIFPIYPTDPDGTPRRLIEAAKAGEIDLTLNLSVVDVVRDGISGFQPMMQQSNSTGILFFNTARIRDTAVRRALQHALDPLRVASLSYEKNPVAFLAGDVIPPLMSKVTASTTMRDRDLLRKLPAKPATLTLVVPWIPRPYLPRPMPAAQEIARQLGEYGVNVRLIETKSSEHYFHSLAQGDYDMSLGGWVADNPDPAEFYESLLSSAQVSTPTEYRSNQARWANAATDAALMAYRADPTPANRKVISDIIENEAILVPLIYGASTAIRARRVKNFHISPSGHVAFETLDAY